MSSLTPYLPAVLVDWQRQFPERAAWEEEGALAFLDVSGFTAMSERLAKLGREGAEVVTDVIGSTFESLMAVAYEAGGSLLKFGGDALLLWFGGDDAARRACQSSARMRMTLRRLGPIPTPMGPVRLRMSAGVHAGTFQFFLVGDPAFHRELLACSPGASRTCVMEAAASAGEILVSPETAERLGRRWFGAESGPGVLLATPPTGGTAVTPTLPDLGPVDPGHYIPTLVRASLAGGGEEAEHKHAAVGFVHFDGTDELIRDHGLEAAAKQLHELTVAVQQACHEHGVALLSSDVDVDGGKFLLCAGAPVASADEDERMLRCLRAIAESDTRLPVRAGANRGLLFAGSIGPSYRRSYTLMGDIVNTAARVMSHAKPGEVLALKPVLDGAQSRFAAKRLPPFAAKGKTRPLVAYRVGRPTGSRAAARTEGRFFGREAELAQIGALFDGARRREGGLLEVQGELGVGKSRLLAEACAPLSDATVVTVRGNPYEKGAPYLPLREVLGDAFDEVARALDPDVDQRVFRARLHAEVVSRLDASIDGLWVLVVEEAQWLDEASAALVRHLGWEARSRQWAVLSARWSNEGPPVATGGVGSVLVLAPLARADAEALVADRAAAPLLPQLAERVLNRGAGNPLFLEQLVAVFDADDDTVLPEGLEALVSARIDKLPVRDRARLRALAVLGVRFGLDDASVVLGADEPFDPVALDLSSLEEFVSASDGVGQFHQSVFQSVAYAGLSFRRRRELHERVALAVEARGPSAERAATLAMHFELAQRDDRAWMYACRAARLADERYAYVAAADLWRVALRSAQRLRSSGGDVAVHDLRAAWQGLGDALRYMGRQHDAAVPYQKARRLAGDDPAVQARLCLVEGDLRHRLGRPVGALRWYRKGLQWLDGVELDEGMRKTRNRFMAGCGKVRYDQGRTADAREQFEQALQEAEAAGDVAGMAHHFLWLSYCDSTTNRPGHAELAAKALALYEQLDAVPWQAAALNSLGLSARREGRWDEARRLLGQASDRMRELGDPVSAAVCDYNLADVLLDQGRADEAVELLRRVVRTFQAAQHGYEPVGAAALARALSESGDVEQAEPLFETAIARLSDAGMGSFAREAEVNWAFAKAVAGELDAAESLLSARGASSDPDLEAMAARVQAVVSWRRGDVGGAAVEAGAARKISADAASPLGVALADLLLADLAGDAGEVRRTEAEAALARLGVVARSKALWRKTCTDRSS